MYIYFSVAAVTLQVARPWPPYRLLHCIVEIEEARICLLVLVERL